MEVHLLDQNFGLVYILDKFESLLWIDRFWSFGELDIKTTPSLEVLSALTASRYARMAFSDRQMVIETVHIKSDVEKGDRLLIQGRSVESIIDRRIIWAPTVITGSLQDSIETLLTDNLIAPTDPARTIDTFLFDASTDPVITELTLDAQFSGETLLDAISAICRAKEIGFRLIHHDGYFHFNLFAGQDRSYDQHANPYVVFSPNFDNLINADYLQTSQYQKTVALLAGEEGIGSERITTTVIAISGAGTGLTRKEMYFEPNVQRNVDGVELTDEEYISQMEGRGMEELAKNSVVQSFDGEVDTTLYEYMTDFNLGDILQVSDNYGHNSKYRVTEMIFSQDGSGVKMYPMFTKVDALAI